MPKDMGTKVWLRHVAVAAAYALLYGLARQLSFPNWNLFAGLRFCALLFVPYRYWPALVVGEFLPLAYTGITCGPKYGWLWAATFMVPPMLFIMPVVRWCRGRRRIFPTRNSTGVNVFLACALSVSAIATAVNMGTFGLMRGPQVEAFHYQAHAVASWYFIGNYIGILTIVPLLLLAREELCSTDKHRIWSKLSESRLVMDTVCLFLPSLALLVWLASLYANQEARMAMFLPVAWLALRHGWRGAALGGTAASIAVAQTIPAAHDSNTLSALVFVAFTVSTMMLLGGRIALLHERERRERRDAQLAFAVAQRNAHLGELQLQQISHALEQMSGSIQDSYTQLLGRLRCLLPGSDERSYYRQAAVAQHQIYRLADSLYPVALREQGLQAALREGSVPRALDEAGIAYWCEITGTGLDQLSKSVHMALYRLSCEAVALACAERNISRIHVGLRCGSFHGRRWALLRVESRRDYERLSRVRWDDLAPALRGSGLGLGALKDRAAVFGGRVRVRSLPDCSRISIILFDSDIH